MILATRETDASIEIVFPFLFHIDKTWKVFARCRYSMILPNPHHHPSQNPCSLGKETRFSLTNTTPRYCLIITVGWGIWRDFPLKVRPYFNRAIHVPDRAITDHRIWSGVWGENWKVNDCAKGTRLLVIWCCLMFLFIRRHDHSSLILASGWYLSRGHLPPCDFHVKTSHHALLFLTTPRYRNIRSGVSTKWSEQKKHITRNKLTIDPKANQKSK